jgi:REP element-mobilizing transposase RayT
VGAGFAEPTFAFTQQAQWCVASLHPPYKNTNTNTEAPISESRRKKGEHGIWQRRFWEHTIRDDEDFKRCLDYVHWNPVKSLSQNLY